MRTYFRDDKKQEAGRSDSLRSAPPLRRGGLPLAPGLSGEPFTPCPQLIFVSEIYLWHMTGWDSSQWWRPTVLQPWRMCTDTQTPSWEPGPRIQHSKGLPSLKPGRRWGRTPRCWGQNLLWRLPQPRHKLQLRECFQPPGRWGPWWSSSGRVWNLLDCPAWRFFSGSDIAQKSAPLCRESWWREDPGGGKRGGRLQEGFCGYLLSHWTKTDSGLPPPLPSRCLGQSNQPGGLRMRKPHISGVHSHMPR